MNRDGSYADVATYRQLLKAAGRSPSTIMLRMSQLGRLAEAFPGRSIRGLATADLIAFFAVQTWGSSTAYSFRATLKDFYEMLRKRGLVKVNPVEDMPPGQGA